MFANYHTHTVRCRHAQGSEREFIESAIARGYTVLGFSDHTPYPFPEGHQSGFRMGVDELENYVTTLSDLKKEYSADITIHIGLEAEYYPAIFDRLLALIQPYPVEYLLLGQHFIGNEYDHQPYSGNRTHALENMIRYVDQTIAGMRTGKFTYFAHPDLMCYVEGDEEYDFHMTRLCRAAKEMDVPLEINFLGLAEGRPYPSERFFRLAAQVGNEVIFGCDAHNPAMLDCGASIERAMKEYIQPLGLHLLDTVPLRDPHN